MKKFWKKCLALTLSCFLLGEAPGRLANVMAATDADFEAYLNAQGFPESYRPALRELHARYPQWVFIAVDTGLDWEEVIRNESLVGRNLVSSSSISSWKSTAEGAYNWESGTWPGFDGSRWVAASEEIIRYYMDPRNFIDETYIFQFLSQSYDASVHTREGLMSLVEGTFLAGTAATSGAYTGAGGEASSDTGGGVSSGTGGGASSGTGGGSSFGPGGAGGSSPSGAGGTVSSGTSGSSSSGKENYGPGFENLPSISNTGGVEVGVPPGGSLSSGGGSTGSTGGNTGSTGGGSTGSTSGNVAADSGNAVIGSQNTSTDSKNTGGTGEKPSGSPPADVQVGIAPGVNVSWAEPALSKSPHQVLPVAATIAQVGPGSETLAQTGGTVSYVDILMEAGMKSGVNPYVLAAMILQEQGSQGSSESISGASGYYNYYNFEAYASNGMTAVQRGLWYASQAGDYMRPWNSPDKAIIGGACQYGQNYVQAGQNTFYLKKFNVQGSNLYKHQYMTNVEGAAAEGAKMGEAYSENMRQTALQFMIPIYWNMPQENSPKPTLDGSPNNRLSGISADGFALTPSFSQNTLAYEIVVDSSVTSVTLHASAIDSAAQIRGTGTISLTQPVTEAQISVTAQNGAIRTYVVRITKNGGGQSSSGTGVQNGSGTGVQSGSGTGGIQIGPGGGNVTIVN